MYKKTHTHMRVISRYKLYTVQYYDLGLKILKITIKYGKK